MKKVLLSTFLVSALALSTAYAQVNIGSTAAPDASAALQISVANLGILPPQISLSNTTTFGLANNTGTPSMLVYNSNATATGTVPYPSFGKGLYMWDGTGWLWLAQKPSITMPLGAASPQIPMAANGVTINVPVPLGAPVGTIGSPTVLPTVDNNTIVFNTSGMYKLEIGGVVGHTTLVSPNPSTGYIRLNIFRNGTSIQRYQHEVREGIATWFHHVEHIEVAAGDVLSLVVTDNTTGFIVPFVTISSLKVELEGMQ